MTAGGPAGHDGGHGSASASGSASADRRRLALITAMAEKTTMGTARNAISKNRPAVPPWANSISGNGQPPNKRSRPPTVNSTMAASNGYCERVASRWSNSARARSWASTTPATWPTTIAPHWT